MPGNRHTLLVLERAMRKPVGYCVPLLAFILFAQPYGSLSSVIESPKDRQPFAAQAHPVGDDTIPLEPFVSQPGTLSAPPVGGCILHPRQYTFSVPGEGTCHLLFLGADFYIKGDQNLKLYVRFGEKVIDEDERIVADYVSESAGPDEGISIFAWSSPPLRAGIYFIAISNCGPEKASYEIYAVFYGIDFAGPVIFRAEVVGERLFLYGLFPRRGGKLFLNGKRQKHVLPDEQEERCILIANKAGKNIAMGETVTLQARFPGGRFTPEFKFTRPLE